MACTQGDRRDDFSQEARAAGELASIIGKHFGARGILVRAYPEIVHWAELQQDQRETYERLLQNILESEKRTLEKCAAELGELLGRPPEVEVSVGDATAAILKAAADEDLEGCERSGARLPAHRRGQRL